MTIEALGIDLGKTIRSVVGIDGTGAVVLSRKQCGDHTEFISAV